MFLAVQNVLMTSRAGLSKCGARLDALCGTPFSGVCIIFEVGIKSYAKKSYAKLGVWEHALSFISLYQRLQRASL